MAMIFGKRLTIKDIDRHLTIPASDAAKFGPFNHHQGINMNVKDVKGNQWTFRCSQPSQSSEITIQWEAFVKHHKLDKDDIIEFYKESDQSHEYKLLFKKGKDNIAESSNASKKR